MSELRPESDIRADLAVMDASETWSERHRDAMVRVLRDIEPLLERVAELEARAQRAVAEYAKLFNATLGAVERGAPAGGTVDDPVRLAERAGLTVDRLVWQARAELAEAEVAVARRLGAQWSDYVHDYAASSAYEDGIRRCGARLIDDMDEARAALAAVTPPEPTVATDPAAAVLPGRPDRSGRARDQAETGIRPDEPGAAAAVTPTRTTEDADLAAGIVRVQLAELCDFCAREARG